MALAVPIVCAAISILTASDIVAGELFLTVVLTSVLVLLWMKLLQRVSASLQAVHFHAFS